MDAPTAPASAPLAAGQLSRHFWLAELTQSQAAGRRGLDNTPGAPELANLRRLAETLERIRALLGGVPILISSGYRAPKVNAAVGGATASLHTLGCAADFSAPAYGSPLQICRAIAASDISFQEPIYEHTWVHFGIQQQPGNPRPRRVMTAVFRRGLPVTYMPGLQE